MSFENILGAANISSSGLSAERLRMEVVANNIANAYSTRTPGGGPFRRQDVVFSAVLDRRLGSSKGANQLGGVCAVDIVDDMSELPRVYNPGHPDADANGFVVMPNVQMANEMVNLMTANRAYEANLKVLQAFRQQAEQALLIGKS
jgi:flagellar basal-body rod protein FlgC